MGTAFLPIFVLHIHAGNELLGPDLQYGADLEESQDERQLVPILVDGACADGQDVGFGFGFAQQPYGHYLSWHTLFHYPEISSLLEGEEKLLTFREAAARAMEGDYNQIRS